MLKCLGVEQFRCLVKVFILNDSTSKLLNITIANEVNVGWDSSESWVKVRSVKFESFKCEVPLEAIIIIVVLSQTEGG